MGTKAKEPGAAFTPEALAEKEAAELAGDILFAKAAEEKCKAWRIAAEEALLAKIGHRPEGSETQEVGDYKVTTTGVIRRTLDLDKWHAVADRIPEDLRPVRVVEEIDEKGVKWLQANRPDLYQVAAEAITTKPGKTGVKVVRMDSEDRKAA